MYIRAFAVCWMALVVSACGFQDVGIVDTEVDSIFANYNAKDIEKILNRHSSAWKENHIATARALLGKMRSTLGDALEWSRTGYNFKSSIRAGTTYVATYAVKFEHGDGGLRFTFLKEDDQLKLQGFNVNSTALVLGGNET